MSYTESVSTALAGTLSGRTDDFSLSLSDEDSSSSYLTCFLSFSGLSASDGSVGEESTIPVGTLKVLRGGVDGRVIGDMSTDSRDVTGDTRLLFSILMATLKTCRSG